jgi:hypothetical protein
MEAAKTLICIGIGTLLFASQVTAQSFLTNGLVAYYPFNGNANDESGYGNNLTNYGATLCADRFGNSNQAYLFNGSNFLGSSNSPLTQVDNWTVAAWLQPASLSQATAYAICVGYDNGESGDGFAIGMSGGNELWAFFPGVTFDDGDFGFPSTNQWYHVVMSRSSGTTTLYVNGNAINTSPILTTPAKPTSFEVGSGGSDRFFAGAVGDVRVYDHAFTASEVQTIYDNGTNSLLPVITERLTNEIVGLGLNAVFSPEAAGNPPLSYQWSFDGTNLAGETNLSLSLTNVQLSQSGGYSVVISNLFDSVTSSVGFLRVVTSPVIATEPKNQGSSIGGSAMFFAAAIGPPPLFFQWEFNGIDIDQETNSALLVTNIVAAQAGSYDLVVSNRYGKTVSSNALLSVLTIPQNLTNGLVAYYPFNGNANDESGYGNDLTNYGATLCADRFGVPNQAYYFNGQSYLGSAVSPLSQVSNWTVTAWIHPTLFPQNSEAVCVGYDFQLSGDELAGDGYSIGVAGNQLSTVYPPALFDFSSFSPLSTNEWYQVVTTFEVNTSFMYLDGDQATNHSPFPLEPSSFEIGSGGPSHYFIGAVDDVRVYNRVLSASEVAQLYIDDQGAPLFPVIVSEPTNEIVSFGGTATFAVSAVASVLVNYQWSFNDVNIAGC